MLPVFYDREPGDVDDAKLHEAWDEFKNACLEQSDTQDLVLQRWRKALKMPLASQAGCSNLRQSAALHYRQRLLSFQALLR